MSHPAAAPAPEIASEETFHVGRVLTIAAGHLVHDVFSGFLPVLLPLLIGRFGLSLFLAGSLTLFLRLPSALNPFLGLVADRFDLRLAAAWAPGMTAVAMSLLGVAPNYFALCGLLVFAGASAAVFHVVGPVLVARASGERVGRGMSWWMTSGELARSLAPLLAVGAVALLGLGSMYPVAALGIAASLLLHVRLRKNQVSVPLAAEGGFKGAWKGLRPVAVPLAGLVFTRSFLTGCLVAFLPTYVVGGGRSLFLGGVAMAVLQGVGTLGSLAGGTLSDRIGRRGVLAAAVPGAALMMLLLAHGPSWSLFPALTGLGMTLFAITPVNMALVQDVAGEYRSTANGLYMGFNFLSTAFATLLTGWLGDLADLSTAFTLGAAVGIVGMIAVWRLPRWLQ
jgi:FSR family fosmidomycin resistance protein-like MFS transporter